MASDRWRAVLDPDVEEGLVLVARQALCAKSKRGVAIFDPYSFEVVAAAYNAPPAPFRCDGSASCREHCGKVAVHAEARALRVAGTLARGADLAHVKVVDGAAVSSGHPSCWQCSKAILDAGIGHVWLLHEDRCWWRYPAEAFHRLTLEHCGLPVVR